MQQLTVADGRLEWRDVAAPVIEDAQQALVRPLAVARCDIDLPYVSGMLPAPRAFAVGHECVGEITAVGDGVTRLRVGQRVIVPFQISCGECVRCRRGFTGSCTGVPFLSAYGMPLNEHEWGGALSDVIRVPFADAMLVDAPADVPAWTLAAAADNASDGWRCVAPYLQAQPGAPVLIVAGIVRSIAAYAADAAIALGAERVDFVSQDVELLALAERLGAHAIEAPFAGTRGPYPITVDASGDPAGLRMALRSTEPEGVCVSPAYYPFDETPIPLGRMYTKGVTFHTGRCHARAVLPEVAAAIAAGRLHPELITTHRVNWAEARDAMAEPGVKLVVER